MPLPGPLVAMLRAHAKTQAQERKTAGDPWIESDCVFTKPLGDPLSPNTDSTTGSGCWKTRGSGTPGCTCPAHGRHRAHAARWLARVIDQIMGWELGSSASMRAR
ncbi:hypothetical protein GCM10010307_65820 [Streptomyces vastus]|uniref:Transposase n=1 Tax=Streptomyces vastus TaxID=285451 RepID=A0ABN3RJA1_9ACTN